MSEPALRSDGDVHVGAYAQNTATLFARYPAKMGGVMGWRYIGGSAAPELEGVEYSDFEGGVVLVVCTGDGAADRLKAALDTLGD